MPSTAVSAQGTAFTVGVTATAKTISGTTKANPVVVTSAAHAFVGGEVVLFAGVTGQPELNGKVGIVTVLTANTFSCKGIDTTAAAAVGTAGTATPTAVVVGNVKDYSGLDGAKASIDVSNMASTAKEFRDGLPDPGKFALNLHTSDADQGQQALRSSLATTGYLSVFKVTLPNGKIRTFSGFVTKFSEQAGVDGVVAGAVDIQISDAVAFT